MTDALIDRATLAELEHTAGPEFVRELVGTLLVEAPLMLDELRAALVAGNVERFRRAAHSLKSNSLTFGARALGATARDLEVRAADVVAARDAQPLETLAREYAAAAAALTDLTRG
jgi:HPt (histidine-containing phosphotransfer) domain-containing protein